MGATTRNPHERAGRAPQRIVGAPSDHGQEDGGTCPFGYRVRTSRIGLPTRQEPEIVDERSRRARGTLIAADRVIVHEFYAVRIR